MTHRNLLTGEELPPEFDGFTLMRQCGAPPDDGWLAIKRVVGGTIVGLGPDPQSAIDDAKTFAHDVRLTEGR